MQVFNYDSLVPSAGSSAVMRVSRLAARVRHYFDQHPEVAREEFLLDAVRREILFREQKETSNRARPLRSEGDGPKGRSAAWPTLSAGDVRIHARLAEHLALLHRERHGLWPKLRRFFFGKPAFLKRIWIFTLAIACPAMALGQVSKTTRSGTPTSQPAATTPLTAGYGDGGYGYGGAPQTVESAALQGLAQVISAEGQYNLATSKAAVNMTEAESNWLRDNVQWRQTLSQMRDIGRAEREVELGPRPTPEELARRARAGAPRGLTTGQIDPVSGALHWPAALQIAGFQAQRGAVDEYAAKWVKYGGLDYGTQSQVRENIGAMLDGLKSRIASMPPQDYVACRTFLQSLLYATTRTTPKRPGFETASSDVRETGWLTKRENNNGRVQSR